jgi:hypothetical protein
MAGAGEVVPGAGMDGDPAAVVEFDVPQADTSAATASKAEIVVRAVVIGGTSDLIR